jgi:glycosyltransferase involved in cell wall biosynthesis
MCTYNGAAFLQPQLESIARQSRPPDELVISDDCSTDSTRQIVDEFAKHAPFAVRLVLNDRNLGSTRNFEKAIGLCNGDVIALSDQDDVWSVEKLKRFEEILTTRPEVGMVFSNGQVVDESLRKIPWSIWDLIRFHDAQQSLFNAGDGFEVLLDHNVVTGATMAFRSRFRKLATPIPTDLMHDGWPVIHDGWLALMISATAPVVFIPELLINYRQHAAQQIGLRSVLEADQTEQKSTFMAAARRRNSFANELHYLQTIYERLSIHATDFPSTDPLRKLRAQITHLRRRALLPKSRVRRIPAILREIVSCRYYLYSNGTRSVAKDLFQHIE